MDIRQSAQYASYMRLLGWQVEKAGEANVFIRKLPFSPFWSVIKVQRPKSIDFKKLDELSRRHHALFVKIEPDHGFLTEGQLRQDGYKKDSWPLLPTRTLVLELTPTLGKIHDTMPKNTRYEIKQALKKGVKVRESSDIQLFYKLLQETMKIGKWSVPIKREVTSLWKAFQPYNSQILLAYSDTVAVGGCLLIWSGGQSHYMYAALTRAGRQNGAAYAVIFKAIEFLKEKEVKSLDLEGLYDNRYPSLTKNWQGFSKFKLSWGGQIVDRQGSLTKHYNWLTAILLR